MKLKEGKMQLARAALAEVQRAHGSAVAQLLESERTPRNTIGVGAGVKWKNGEPTGEPALVVLVTRKEEKGELSADDLVPAKIAEMQTDVLEVGYPFAGDAEPPFSTQTLAKRMRPAKGGYSVGHYHITAGTIATGVYDTLPGGGTRPPTHGVGIPPKYYILSNNHVLADSNAGSPGDPILQPGPYDGGTDPADRIATLTRYVPLTFYPSTPLTQHNNLVDAAIAQVEFHDLDRGIYWIGYARGWRRKAEVTVGTVVKKTGRTTNFTTSRITVVNATIDVGYGGGKVARLKDQIVTTNMSAGGDSGSLVLTLDDVAVGLLFAGSSTSMIANQIENVRALLKVEVAEQVL